MRNIATNAFEQKRNKVLQVVQARANRELLTEQVLSHTIKCYNLKVSVKQKHFRAVSGYAAYRFETRAAFSFLAKQLQGWH